MQTGALLTHKDTKWKASLGAQRMMTFVQSSRTGKATKTHIVQRCLQIELNLKVKMTKHKTQGHDLWEGGWNKDLERSGQLSAF